MDRREGDGTPVNSQSSPAALCDMFMRLQIYIHSKQFHSLAEIGKVLITKSAPLHS